MEENVAKELPGEVNPGMLTPLRSMSNGLWSCQMLSSSLSGRLFFLPLVSKLEWIAFELPFCAEIRIGPWDYLLKVRQRNAGTYWYLSVSVTGVHSVNTNSRVPRPANSKSPRFARMVGLRKDQSCDECCLFSPLLGPCSRAVNIPSLMYRQLLMWDLILPVLLRRLSFVPLHHYECDKCCTVSRP